MTPQELNDEIRHLYTIGYTKVEIAAMMQVPGWHVEDLLKDK